MSLPDLIEIVPLDKPVRAEITVPGSKSITNRALILAALAEGEVTLEGALWSEDTQIMVECLQELGFMMNVAPDPNEVCNRTVTVYGQGGRVPSGGTEERPLELFVGNAGTAARFLAAFVCLGRGVYRLHGAPRMHERPQAALFLALRELGYQVEAENGNDKLPARIWGGAGLPVGQDAQQRVPAKRSCTVSIEESSQFASALLLGARTGGWEIKVTGENAEESPYVVMTSKLIEAFPKAGGKFQIEPDASSGSYFWAAGTLNMETAGSLDTQTLIRQTRQCGGFTISGSLSYSVTVAHWPRDSGWQIDARSRPHLAGLLLHQVRLPGLEEIGVMEHWSKDLRERQGREHEQYLEQFYAEHGLPRISRRTNLGDSIMTVIVLAPLAHYQIQFTDLGRLRVQECERVAALRTELAKCGAKVIEEGDTLTVYPSKLHGAEIETYNDHRMAMCFAILGLKVPGIKIKNPACVKKTFPNFFQKLAAPPPQGLGATIRDAKTGRKLELTELFAD
jgi:3-phosphoshikimate 1-carboxyvinyltransferase